ncbi:unnamed protein product [Owenia fusiformis]|uniref:Uncharacterized protein n=1 Tax=Owenia fusiformis TaxID=6347 RepID=A0A8J1U754_OWEFU|nr:unnamed protein product [Owenia fusiformis]
MKHIYTPVASVVLETLLKWRERGILNYEKTITTVWVFVVSIAAISLVVAMTTASLFCIVSAKSAFHVIISLFVFIGELIVALLAALCSGVTICTAVVASVAASVLAIPASVIHVRVMVSVAVAGFSMVISSMLMVHWTEMKMDVNAGVALFSTAAIMVALAAAWAVGVMSLIEKETKQVGLRMTSILDAVRTNNHRILKLLLTVHTGLHQRELNLALLHGVKLGYTECVEILLTSGGSPDCTDAQGSTCLYLAAEIGSVRLCSQLISAGCNIDKRSGNKGCALHQAAKWGYDEVVMLLLGNGADTDVQDGGWNTPLILAAKNAYQAQTVINLLVESGCDVNIRNSEQRTALHYAATRGLDVSLMLEHGALHSINDFEGNKPLHLSASEGTMNVLEALLEHGASTNVKNIDGRTPVHYAAMKGHLHCLQTLALHWGDLGSLDNEGATPLSYAVQYDRVNIISFLLRNTKRQNCLKTMNKHDLLHLALTKQFYNTARLLIIAGYTTPSILDLLPDMTGDCKTMEDDLDLLLWLHRTASVPHGLSEICRVVIRDHIERDLVTGVGMLPLPKTLQMYLSIPELEQYTPH